MRNLLLVIIATFAFSYGNTQGIEFFHGTWQEALNEAGKQGKLIFVDAYTTWCGPCKRMSMSVFPDPEVGQFYNANFINMKLDMEKGEGLEFRRQYPVQAFPTFFYIDGKGAIVYTTKGAKQIPEFIELGKLALSKYDGSVEYEKRYQAGERDYTLVYTYVKELNKTGKPSLKISNEYLNSKPDITEEQRMKFLLEAAVQLDSRIFEMLIEGKKEIIRLEGEDAFFETVRKAIVNTAERAIQYESKALLDQSIQAMEQYFPESAPTFAVESRMDYALTYLDSDGYLENATEYLKKIAPEEPGALNALAEEILKYFHENQQLLAIAGKAMEKSLKLEESVESYATYTGVLIRQGDKEKALDKVNKGIQFAQAQQQPDKLLQALKRMIENS